jgi:hypothetical protein
MQALANDIDNETGKNLYGMGVFWRIAEKYGSRQLEDKKKKYDTKTLFN